MRHYFRTFAARFGNVLCRNAQQQFNRRPFASAGAKVVGGGATMLSLGFFGAGKKKQQEETKLPGEEDLVIREADMLYDNYLVDNAYNLLRRYRSSNDSEFLWRLARVLCEQGKQTKNAAERKRLYSEALEYAEKAVKCEPTSGSFGAHKWYAIILNYNTELEGTKAQLAKAMDVKTHFERALELNPLDATTWHLLGLWHYSFANLSTYERWGASLIYSKPPQSTVEEALRHFERAEAINPNFYSANNYYLGLCYERQNRRNEALDQLTKAFIAPVITMDDRQTHEKALLHLRKNYKINEAKLVEEQK